MSDTHSNWTDVSFESISLTAEFISVWVLAFRIPFAITAVSLIADIAAENSTITLLTLLVVGDIRIIQISCCWGITGTTSPDVVKSRHTTRKRTARLLAHKWSVVKFSSTVRSRLWHSAKWRDGKYGGVIPSPLRTPGCQVDHTLKWQPRCNALCYQFSGDVWRYQFYSVTALPPFLKWILWCGECG